jgi:hypothetical protein
MADQKVNMKKNDGSKLLFVSFEIAGSVSDVA